MATAQSSDPMPAICGMSDSIAPSGQGGQPAPGAMTCDIHKDDPVFKDVARFTPDPGNGQGDCSALSSSDLGQPTWPPEVINFSQYDSLYPCPSLPSKWV